MPIAADEDIVRAIFTDKWDGTRIAPSLFKGQNVSVSRLAVISLTDHWDMFRRYLEKPPERRLELIGEISVGKLQKLGRDYQRPIELTVEPKPEDWNPAHAEIPQRITRGLATEIVNALKRHRSPRR
jgi:hypothetical protein